MDVALVTCAALPGLHSDDRYILHALRGRRIDAVPVVWEDSYQDWAIPRLCVIRSVWDYAYRCDEFLTWAERVADVSRLFNPLHVLTWNAHKSYLCDLEARGIRVTPTQLLRRGGRVALDAQMAKRGWEDAVLKPAVGASGRHAMRVGPDTVARGQAHLDRLLPFEDMLLQPYLRTISEDGELSLVFIDGTFTHAVRKQVGQGEFRVHSDYGGTVVTAKPSQRELTAASRALEAVGERTLYARVDLGRGEDGNPLVTELELIEPELFLRFSAEAVERLAEAVEQELQPD